MAGETPSFGQITRSDLEHRFKDFTSDFYSRMAFLAKGGVLTIAAITFIELFPDAAGRPIVERVIFFSASFVEVLVPIVTYRRGLLLASPRIALFDYIAPLGMAGAEIMMFKVLSSDWTSPVDYRASWFLAVAFHGLFAVALVWTRLRMTRVSDFGDDLATIVRRYRGWLRRDLLGAGILAIAALVTYFTGRFLGLDKVTIELGLLGASIDLGSIFPAGYIVAALAVGALALTVSLQSIAQQQELGKWFAIAPLHSPHSP